MLQAEFYFDSVRPLQPLLYMKFKPRFFIIFRENRRRKKIDACKLVTHRNTGCFSRNFLMMTVTLSRKDQELYTKGYNMLYGRNLKNKYYLSFASLTASVV
jgi:hypothetical protein